MFDASEKMDDGQRADCAKAIHTASAAAAAVGGGLAQLPFSDSVPLVGIQITMVIALGGIFDIRITESIARGIIRSQLAKVIGKTISRTMAQALIGWLPGVGNVINAATAAALTEMIGWDVAALFAKQAHADAHAARPIKSVRAPAFGDVICVHRPAGLMPPFIPYDHYGVYESDERVYAFCTASGDIFGEDARVRAVTLERFMEGDELLSVLDFPKSLPSGTEGGDAYRLMSPSETVERARSAVGRRDYNFVTNNCEHFAIWCKTDMHKSFQVDDAVEWLVTQ